MATGQPQAPFQRDPQLTSVVNAYKNEALISEEALPVIRVSQETFKYAKFAKGERFKVPDTKVGRLGTPGQWTWQSTEETGKVNDYGLDTPLPNKDADQEPIIVNRRARAAERVMDLVLLDKERAASTLIFTSTNYNASNRATLSGTDQWSHASSNPVTKVLETKDTMIMRPNVMIVGRLVATQLKTHTLILAAYNRTGVTGAGVAPLSFVAELFEMDKILVGGAWYDEKALGQDPSIARVWGKHASMLHVDMNATQDEPTTFGATFIWPYAGSDRISGVIQDPDMGVVGGVRVRSGMRYTHKVINDEFGYLFTNAVA